MELALNWLELWPGIGIYTCRWIVLNRIQIDFILISLNKVHVDQVSHNIPFKPDLSLEVQWGNMHEGDNHSFWNEFIKFTFFMTV
jgi:hypothetical protein